MKSKRWSKLAIILALLALSPVWVSVLVALAVIAIAVCLIFALIIWLRRIVARMTFNSSFRRLLRELHKVGTPPPDDVLDDCGGCQNPNHATRCTPRTCVFKRQAEYYRLVFECQQEHVPAWRVRWAV